MTRDTFAGVSSGDLLTRHAAAARGAGEWLATRRRKRSVAQYGFPEATRAEFRRGESVPVSEVVFHEPGIGLDRWIGEKPRQYLCRFQRAAEWARVDGSIAARGLETIAEGFDLSTTLCRQRTIASPQPAAFGVLTSLSVADERQQGSLPFHGQTLSSTAIPMTSPNGIRLATTVLRPANSE
jgi:hypothetical protein